MSKTAKDLIVTLPHANLRQRSKKVGLISQEIKDIVRQMQDATLDWEASRQYEVGVALAAVQIDQLYRIVVIRTNFDNKKDRSFQVFINPEITKFEGQLQEDFEGCLSVRSIYGKVPRYPKVKVRAQNLDGKVFRVTAQGFLARVFQHEIDHTNGKLFIDHIKDKPDNFFKLNDDGKLEPLNYEQQIKDSRILW